MPYIMLEPASDIKLVPTLTLYESNKGANSNCSVSFDGTVLTAVGYSIYAGEDFSSNGSIKTKNIVNKSGKVIHYCIEISSGQGDVELKLHNVSTNTDTRIFKESNSSTKEGTYVIPDNQNYDLRMKVNAGGAGGSGQKAKSASVSELILKRN